LFVALDISLLRANRIKASVILIHTITERALFVFLVFGGIRTLITGVGINLYS